MADGTMRRHGGQIKHGHAANGGSPEYRSWKAMKSRCCNPHHTHAAWYGDRGITVCEEWQNSFEAFFRDMGPKPSPAHTLDRRKNERGYEPGNCRWATKREQRLNQRQNSPEHYAEVLRRLRDEAGAEKTAIRAKMR